MAVQPSTTASTLKRLPATGAAIVLRHGDREFGDILNARDVWVFAHEGRYYMHYDAAGEQGWLAALATSDDGITWTKKGTLLELGPEGAQDSASASYATTFFDGERWHMFYLGTPNVTDDGLKTPSFPYMTMKAEGDGPTGPWRKRPDVIPFRAEEGSWYSDTASPGHILRHNDEYIQIFSAATTDNDGAIFRTLGIARSQDLDGSWTVDPEPLLPLTEQIENSSLYFEPSNGMWFLFTNHITSAEGWDPVPPQNSSEFTDAVWVYWSTDPTRFSAADKAVVIDSSNCEWSPRVIGLPSVVPIEGRLAVYYDGAQADTIGHGGRDIGVAWLDLPLNPPDQELP